MLRNNRASTMITAPILGLFGCVAEPLSPDAGHNRRGESPTARGFAIESHIDTVASIGDICVLHVLNETAHTTGSDYTGLVVSQHDSEGALCGLIDPYLGGDDRLLEWDLANTSPITNPATLQNLSEAYDQATGRAVDYVNLLGPVREWLWGATYNNGGTIVTSALGSTCVVFVETDAGHTIGFVEQEVDGQCANIGTFITGAYTVQIRAEDTVPLGDPTTAQELTDALYPGGTIEYREANAPLHVLYPVSQGGDYEGVPFTDAQALATLELVNQANLEFLDDTVGLHAWAAQNIVTARPLATIDELSVVYWVGPSALTVLRDFECSIGTEWLDAQCVPSTDSNLLPLGGDCLAGGSSVCASGLCTTSWDGYFCYYTACTATCETVQDCEQEAIAAGFAPQDVIGSLWCSSHGICDLTYLQAGGQSCE